MPSQYFNTPIYSTNGFPLAAPTSLLKGLAALSNSVFAAPMAAFQSVLVGVAPRAVYGVKSWMSDRMIPMSHELPLMDPVDILFCLCMYLVGLAFFFLVGRVTGKLECRAVGIVYNFILVFLSLYMAVGFGWGAIASGYSLWNNGCHLTPHSEAMRNMFWIFMTSKLLEYTDTFLMVLKHNYRQVTFLHMYHHTSVLFIAYMWTAIGPCGDGYWCPMVNSAIHVVMYSYYLLNMLFKTGPVREFLRKNKFIITYGQLTQFVLDFIQAIYVLFIAKQARYSRMLMWMSFFYMITMLTLFGNFLIQGKRQALAATRTIKRKKQ